MVVPFARIDEVIAKVRHVREIELALDAEVAAGLKVPQSILDLLDSDAVGYRD